MTINTEVRLYTDQRLVPNSEDTFYFRTHEEKMSWFNGQFSYNFTAQNFAYSDMDTAYNYIDLNVMSWPLKTCNYGYYFNPDFNTKPVFFFILYIEFLSEESCRVYFSTDWWMTYMHEVSFPKTLIERELISKEEDNLHYFLYEEEEGLDFGEHTFIRETSIGPLNEIAYLLMATETELGIGLGIGNKIGDLIMSMSIFNFTNDSIGALNFGALLGRFAQAGKSEAIQCVYSIPRGFLDHESFEKNAWVVGGIKALNSLKIFYDVGANNGLNNYRPKNKKLLNYPYNFLMAYNNNGTSAIFKYERMPKRQGLIQFESFCDFQPSATATLNLTGYNGGSYSYTLFSTPYPQIPWVTDFYTNWLAQNKYLLPIGAEDIKDGAITQRKNYDRNFIASANTLISDMSAGTGIASLGGIYANVGSLNPLAMAGGMGSAGLSYANNIRSQGNSLINNLHANHENMLRNYKNDMRQWERHTMAAVETKKVLPNQAGGAFSTGSINLMSNNQGFTLSMRQISSQYAEKIDHFFSKYGYKINKYRDVHLYKRSVFDFIQTANSNCNCGNPIAKQYIDSMFNSGVRLWHRVDAFLNYDIENI